MNSELKSTLFTVLIGLSVVGGVYMCQPAPGETLGDKINEGLRKIRVEREKDLERKIREIMDDNQPTNPKGND